MNSVLKLCLCLVLGTVFLNAPTPAAEHVAANDDFSDAIPLTLGVTVTNSYLTATVEPGDPVTNGFETVWYSFTAPASRSFAFRSEVQTGQYVALFIFSGSELTNLVRLRAFTFRTGAIKITAFRAEEGTNYKLAVALFPDARERSIALTAVHGHPHDDLKTAYELSGLFAAWTNSFNGATSEPGEESVGAVYEPSIWLRWTAPESGMYKIAVGHGTKFGIFHGTAYANITNVSGFPKRVGTFSASQAESYYIRLTPDGYPEGDFIFRLGPAPPNEMPATATTISGTNVSVTGQNWTSSYSGHSELHVGSLWWEWTAPANGLITVTGGGGPTATTPKYPP